MDRYTRTPETIYATQFHYDSEHWPQGIRRQTEDEIEREGKYGVLETSSRQRILDGDWLIYYADGTPCSVMAANYFRAAYSREDRDLESLTKEQLIELIRGEREHPISEVIDKRVDQCEHREAEWVGYGEGEVPKVLEDELQVLHKLQDYIVNEFVAQAKTRYIETKMVLINFTVMRSDNDEDFLVGAKGAYIYDEDDADSTRHKAFYMRTLPPEEGSNLTRCELSQRAPSTIVLGQEVFLVTAMIACGDCHEKHKALWVRVDEVILNYVPDPAIKEALASPESKVN